MQHWLSKQSSALLAIYCIAVVMISYTCMYGIRLPYRAATFDNIFLFGIPYKVVLVVSQVLGYMTSKFIGIKVISELKKEKRIFYIVVLNLLGLLSLLLFAITPYPFACIWMFFNGLPLGMMFGLVFSYLEGRRITEILSVGLASSIIVSSGYVKTVGKLFLQAGITEKWMPFITGCIFFCVLIVSALLIKQIPEPTQKDIESRTMRVSLTHKERKKLFSTYATGIILLVFIYTLLTIIRDYRDTFMVEIWAENGRDDASVLTRTEWPIAIIVLLNIGLTVWIKNHFWAFKGTLFMIGGGALLLIISGWLFGSEILNIYQWTILSGLGIFTGYIVFNTIIFERMIASFQIRGNFGYLMYLADSIGYLGSIAVLLSKEFFPQVKNHTVFLLHLSVAGGILCLVGTIASFIYFRKKYMHKNYPIKKEAITL